jgi:hypothetical protein
MLEHNVRMKVKDNKTNKSILIDKFIINEFRWDLRSSNILIEVLYYFGEYLVLKNEFIFQGKTDVDINKLIDEVIEKHYGQDF